MIPPWMLLGAVGLAWLAVFRQRRIRVWHVAVAVFGTFVAIYVLAGHPHGLS